MVSRILIKHLAGSKVHQVEQFELDDTHELLIGRGPAANVSYDGQVDDTVSRRHALIRITRYERLSLSIMDLGSRNGIRVNGKYIQDEQVFLPGDLIELSPTGPAFKVVVDPDPIAVTSKQTRTHQPATMDPLKPQYRLKRIALWVSLVTIVLGAGIAAKTWTRGYRQPAVASEVQATTTHQDDARNVAVVKTQVPSVAAQ